MAPLRPAKRSSLRLGFTLGRGIRVGLYGGSFNPAHEGHAHVARVAMRRLALDRVIWLVSPGNPLKPEAEAQELDDRLTGARKLARGRRMLVSDAERRLGVRYSLDTVRRLKSRFPAVRFVFIIGADNLAGFRAWRGWTRLMAEVPLAVVARRTEGAEVRFSSLARRFAGARQPESAARRLADAAPPAWIYLTAPLHPASSTKLRKARATR